LEDQEENAEGADADSAGQEGLLSSAKDLRKRAEALLQKNISLEDAAEIRELISQSALAIAGADWSLLADKNEALSDVLFYLED
jgi:hypothetical protein